MHKDVKTSADTKDVTRLRYIFVDCLDVDPTFEKYQEDFEYCKDIPGLFEIHKELTPVQNNKNGWNEQYWIKLKTDLLTNFSLKRFEHMKQVAQVVYADKIHRLQNERRNKEQVNKRSINSIEEGKMLHVSNNYVKPSVQQKKELEQRRAQMKEENRLAELDQKRSAQIEEQSRQIEQAEQIRQARVKNREQKDMEKQGSKKFLGVVLVVIIVLIILIVMMQANLTSAKETIEIIIAVIW